MDKSIRIRRAVEWLETYLDDTPSYMDAAEDDPEGVALPELAASVALALIAISLTSCVDTDSLSATVRIDQP